jgi:hypothetical protein
VPWLSVAPASGTTAPGSSSEVTVGFDAAALSAGVHTANLCVGSNDPDQPSQSVPVSLTVQELGFRPAEAQVGASAGYGTLIKFVLDVLGLTEPEDPASAPPNQPLRDRYTSGHSYAEPLNELGGCLCDADPRNHPTRH